MIIVNGEIIENNKINIDSGYEFGHGLFETVAVKNSRGIFLEEHLERLNNGLETLKINKSVSNNQVEDAINRLLLTEGALKIIVSENNTIFKSRENPYSVDSYKKGFSIRKANSLRNETSQMTYMKTLCYNDNILELNAAKVDGFQEVYFENTKGYICEGSLSNLFFVKDNIIYTPSLECGLLNGVLRRWILESFDVKEGFYKKDDLYNSDEIFLTNSLMGVMRVVNIENIEKKENSVCDEIYKIYNDTIKDSGIL